jgi:peptide deformylase
VAFPLSAEIDFTIDECINTLRNVEGFWEKRSMSISAPQVCKFHRLFVMCDQRYWYHPKLQYKKFMTFINPEIVDFSTEKCEAWEACVSDESQIVMVDRPKVVKVRFMSIAGKEHDMVAHGLLSRIFQHEIDHLDGKLMHERATKS